MRLEDEVMSPFHQPRKRPRRSEGRVAVGVCFMSQLGCPAAATPAEALGLSGEASRELVTPFAVAESQRGVSGPRHGHGSRHPASLDSTMLKSRCGDL